MRKVLPAVANLQKPTLVALRMSLKTGVIIDSQFYLYSHRNLNGSVDKPRPIYASSKVLETAADHSRSRTYTHRSLSRQFAKSRFTSSLGWILREFRRREYWSTGKAALKHCCR